MTDCIAYYDGRPKQIETFREAVRLLILSVGAFFFLAVWKQKFLLYILFKTVYKGSQYRADCICIYSVVLEIRALTFSWSYQLVELRPAPISYHSAIGRYPRWNRILLQCYSINNEHCVTM